MEPNSNVDQEGTVSFKNKDAPLLGGIIELSYKAIIKVIILN